MACTVIWIVTRWTQNLCAGVLAGVLIAIDRDQIFYATEARSYALAQLIGVLQIYFLAELILHRTTLKLIVCVFLTSLMIYLHYTTGLILVAECIAVVAYCVYQKKSDPLASTVVVMACSVLICLPLLSHMTEVHSRRNNWAGFIFANHISEIFTIMPMWILLMVPAMGLIADRLFIKVEKPKESEEAVSDSLLIVRSLNVVLLVILPIAITWLITSQFWLPLFSRRYLIVSLGGTFLLTGLVVGMIQSRVIQIIIGVVCISLPFLLTAATGSYHYQRMPNNLSFMRYEDWRSTVQLLNREKRFQSGPILLASGLIEAEGLRDSSNADLVDYSLLPMTSAYPLEFDSQLIPLSYNFPGELQPWQLNQLGDSHRFTIVVRARRPEALQLVIDQLQTSLNHARDNSLPPVHLKVVLEKDYHGIYVRLLERT